MSWIKENKINILVQVGLEKEPDLPKVPLLLDLVTDEDRKGVIRVVSLPTALGYGHWMAPGVPKDRVAALRAAYAAVMKDPEFITETKKTGMVIRAQAGETLDGLVRQVTSAPRSVLDRTAQILKWK
jgi:tripartite-type tricarboxylate transporter receptor subunit TctC